MVPTLAGPDAARIMRVLHLALTGGLLVIGATFVFLIRLQGPLVGAAISPLVFAVPSLGQVAFAVIVFRRRIPSRPSNQSIQDYWSSAEVRGASVILWALLEGAGLLAGVGYLLTGRLVAGSGVLVALVALIATRPSGLEGEQ